MASSACSDSAKVPGAGNYKPYLDKMQGGGGSGGQPGGGGSGAAGGCQPAPMEIFLQADKLLNPNENDQSMPVEVRVLLLKERETFDQLDFETLWHHAKEGLGKDLVKSTSLIVFPGKLKIQPMKSVVGVSYVALVGIFRQPQGRSWKYMIDVRAQNSQCAGADELHTIIHARLKGNRIQKPKAESVEEDQ